MLLKLPNDDRIQVEHVERVTRPQKVQGGSFWSFRICFSSGDQVNVDGDQDEIELAHKRLISAMADRP